MDAAQQEAATLVLWMIIVGTIVTGVVGSAALGWLERRAVSNVMPSPAPEITSSPPASAPSSPSVSQTDAAPVVVQAAPREPTRAEILDACKVLRAKGLSREEARIVFGYLHRRLDNNLWADAAPGAQPADDEIITPYAGRRTKASYYPENPELEYVEPRV